LSAEKTKAGRLTTELSFLKSAAQSYAVIDNTRSANLFAVYARGDRRRRPMGWMSNNDVNVLYQYGHLKRIKKGLTFTYNAERALLEDRWCLDVKSGQIHDKDKIVYVPSGLQRRVKNRDNTQILKRLAKERDPKGRTFFSSDELEAGAHFQRDYNRAYGIGRETQDFTSVHVDYTRQNQEELAAVSRLDAGQSYKQAKAALGSGLDQAVDVICGAGKSFERLEREQYWARGSGRIILKLALQRLVEYYGTRPGFPRHKPVVMS